ncbi:MAG: hypothetical protein V1853_05250 [bacterium]
MTNKHDNQIPRRNRLIASVLLSAMIFVVVFGLAIPRKAEAFPGEAMLAAVYTEIKTSMRWLWDNAKKAFEKAQETAYDVAFKNYMSTFLGRVAEDTAIWISSAGTGQSPLFITNPHYWRDLNDAAAGDFLDTISSDVFGYSLCEPLDVNKKVQLELATRNLINPLNVCENSCNSEFDEWEQEIGLANQYLVEIWARQANANPKTLAQCPTDEIFGSPTGAPNPTEMTNIDCYQWLQSSTDSLRAGATSRRDKCLSDCNQKRRTSKCTATTVWNNIRDIEEYTIEFQLYFEPAQNDIGQLLTLYGLTREKQQEAVDAEKTIYDDNLGAVTSSLKTDILTPKELVVKKSGQSIEDSSKIETTQTGSFWADIGGVFMNTLTQRVMDRFFKGKCGLNPAACSGPSATESRLGGLLFGSNAPRGIAAARLQFSSLARVDYRTGDPAKSTIAVSDRLVSTGIIDSGFRQAIDDKMTLREAIENGLINGNKTFGFDESNVEAETGIPYRSIVYLRKYRVVPVGWELAAIHIRDADQQAYGLQELIDLYDWCGQDAQHGIVDPFNPDNFLASPFCGLIDPAWVLKAPETYCRRQGAGDEIISRQFNCDQDTNGDGKNNCSPSDIGGGDIGSWTIARNPEVCVDEPNCIKEDERGNCLAFGYCFEEKPIWRFGGEECPGYYSSCRTYVDALGVKNYYLKDTLDSGDCSPENAGCKWYCSDYGYNDVNNSWNCREDSGDKFFFDRDVRSCNDSAVDCTELVRTSNGSNVLKNAGFEYYSGEADDAVADTFGYCSQNGNACLTNADCGGSPYVCDGWRASSNLVETLAISTDTSGVGSPNSTSLQLSGASGTRIEHIFDTYRSLSGLSVTFSYYGKSTGGACNSSFGLQSFDTVFTLGVADEPPANYTDDWQRLSATFNIPELVYTDSRIIAYINTPPGCSALVDSAKLEIGDTLTGYTDYQTVNEVSLKIDQTTLMSNGDFSLDDGTDFFSYPAPADQDNSSADDLIPDGWALGAGGISEIDKTLGYFDSTSLKLTTANNRLYAEQLVPVEFGKTYEVSGMIKTNLDANGGDKPFGAIVTECVYGPDQPDAYDVFFPPADEPSECLLANFETHIRPSVEDGDNQFAVLGAQDWTPVRFNITANNPDIGFVKILCYNVASDIGGIQADGSGSIWCDNLKVTESPLICTKGEVGCERYRPIGLGSSVSGIVLPSDICPNSQVGCRQFREMPIERVPDRPVIDPVYFIESSGNQCSVSQVGCEEYTNLDIEGSGGEEKEYFLKIRQCVKPSDPNAANFYTWEGSEDSGYQLRAFKLLKSNLVNTAFDPDEGGPLLPETGTAPCTNLSVGSTITDPVCEDDPANIATCLITDIGINPDCTEYFGDNGEVFYRLKSRTIFVSDDCHPYRNTIDAQAGIDNIYQIIPSQAVRCSESAAGCRQYKGTTAGSTRSIYSDTFENGTIGDWVGGVSYSNESVNAGGHSMRTTKDTIFSIDLSESISNGNSYGVKFWYKPRDPGGQLAFRISDEFGNEVPSQVVTVTSEWAEYELGPVYLNFLADPPSSVFTFEFTTPVTSTLPGGWIDNISIIESIDSIFKIKGTQTSCEAAYAGCSLYIDRNNKPIAITSFSNLCADRAVGCEAFTYTQNSDYPFVQKIHEDPEFLVPGDTTLGFVNSPKYSCRADDQGCQEFGLPVIDKDNQVQDWSAANLINDPDTYSFSACHPDELWCAEYTEEITGAQSYFRDPGNRTCEYRTGAAQSGLLVDGWFISGTNDPCPTVSLTCRGGALAGELCRTVEEQKACLISGGYCIAYPYDGEEKEVSLVCAGTCNGGADQSKQCLNNGDCGNICQGGPENGQSCLINDSDQDCELGGGVCSVGKCGDGGARPYCDGRHSGSINTDQNNCHNLISVPENNGVCVAVPSVGRPSVTCAGGPLDGYACRTDDDCCEVADCGDPVATCSNYWVGQCNAGAAGCTEFRDPLDPPKQPRYSEGCNIDCTLHLDEKGNYLEIGPECQPYGTSDAGRPGCQPYYILRQSLTSQVSECGSLIDFEIGCQPFYDTANPITNFIGG